MPTSLAQTAALLDERREAAVYRTNAAVARTRAQIPVVATCLLREFGADRVYLFGSFATGSADSASDLDIALEGLDSARYFDALAAVGRLVDVPVDLIRLEDASVGMKARILREGVLIAG